MSYNTPDTPDSITTHDRRGGADGTAPGRARRFWRALTGREPVPPDPEPAHPTAEAPARLVPGEALCENELAEEPVFPDRDDTPETAAAMDEPFLPGDLVDTQTVVLASRYHQLNPDQSYHAALRRAHDEVEGLGSFAAMVDRLGLRHHFQDDDLTYDTATTRDVFEYGHCDRLALALHERTGWPLVGLRTDNGEYHHYLVRAPDGDLVDVRGARPETDVCAAWGTELDATVQVEDCTPNHIGGLRRLAADTPPMPLADEVAENLLATYRPDPTTAATADGENTEQTAAVGQDSGADPMAVPVLNTARTHRAEARRTMRTAQETIDCYRAYLADGASPAAAADRAAYTAPLSSGVDDRETQWLARDVIARYRHHLETGLDPDDASFHAATGAAAEATPQRPDYTSTVADPWRAEPAVAWTPDHCTDRDRSAAPEADTPAHPRQTVEERVTAAADEFPVGPVTVADAHHIGLSTEEFTRWAQQDINEGDDQDARDQDARDEVVGPSYEVEGIGTDANNAIWFNPDRTYPLEALANVQQAQDAITVYRDHLRFGLTPTRAAELAAHTGDDPTAHDPRVDLTRDAIARYQRHIDAGGDHDHAYQQAAAAAAATHTPTRGHRDDTRREPAAEDPAEDPAEDAAEDAAEEAAAEDPERFADHVEHQLDEHPQWTLDQAATEATDRAREDPPGGDPWRPAASTSHQVPDAALRRAALGHDTERVDAAIARADTALARADAALAERHHHTGAEAEADEAGRIRSVETARECSARANDTAPMRQALPGAVCEA